MDEIKAPNPKQLPKVMEHLDALQDLNQSLVLRLSSKARYMDNSFLKNDLLPKLKELILKTSELELSASLET